jgi:hypothetical protein
VRARPRAPRSGDRLRGLASGWASKRARRAGADLTLVGEAAVRAGRVVFFAYLVPQSGGELARGG